MPKPAGYLPPFSPPSGMNHVESWRWITRHLRACMEHYLVIRDEHGNKIPFVLNNIQRKHLAEFMWDMFIARKPVRWVVLKSRRMGWSTLVAGIYFLLTKYQLSARSLITAHEDKACRNLIEMHRIFESEINAKYNIKTSSYQDNALVIPHASYQGHKMEWLAYRDDGERKGYVKGGGSRIHIQSARSVAGAASDALTYVHFSEIGYSEHADWAKVSALTGQCVPFSPGTAIIQEGTAMGVGNYLHNLWTGAIKGDNGWKPKFDAWWEFENYRVYDDFDIEPIGETGEERDKDLQALSALRELIDSAWKINEATPEKREQLIYERDAALRWRQSIGLPKKCEGNVQTLHSQYPSTWQEAFVSTGEHFFDMDLVNSRIAICVNWEAEVAKKQAVEKLVAPNVIAPKFPRYERTKNGPYLRVLNPPEPNGTYCVAADSSYGSVGGDPSAAIVWNWRKRRVEAVWHARDADVGAQAQDWTALGTRYSAAGIPAELIPENNGPGTQVINIARDTLNYPTIYRPPRWTKSGTDWGFSTNTTTRSKALASLKNQLATYAIMEQRIWEQCGTFGYNGAGKPVAMYGAEDEFVTCLWIIAAVSEERGEVDHPHWIAPDKPVPMRDDGDDGNRYILIEERDVVDPERVIQVKAVVESSRTLPRMMGATRGHVQHKVRDKRTLWMNRVA